MYLHLHPPKKSENKMNEFGSLLPRRRVFAKYLYLMSSFEDIELRVCTYRILCSL